MGTILANKGGFESVVRTCNNAKMVADSDNSYDCGISLTHINVPAYTAF